MAAAGPASSRAGARKALNAQQDLDLVDQIAEFYDDPLGFVLMAFPWGEKGTRLENQTGPDQWQIDVLNDIGTAVRSGMKITDALPVMLAVASGHGIGKTALIAWIILWFIATRAHPQIIVTAGKQDQLSGKTWREVAKWNKLSICGRWFHWTATKLEHVLAPETWFAHAIPWSKNAPENFAGTHEEHVLVIYDEASAIDDVIWETTDGAMTTPGAMWIAFGNPTKTSGRFYSCFHGKHKALWNSRHVDSRTAKMANRKILDKWIEIHGLDSDFVRVRVLGQFPRHGDMQFISIEEYLAATRRTTIGYEEYGRVLGVDVARHGMDQTVICRRQGRMVWPLKRVRIPDLMVIAGLVAEVIEEFKPDTVFIDATGMGWGVVDRLRQLGHRNIVAVQTGETANEPQRFRRKREELWWKVREFIRAGGQLPVDPELESELTTPEYWYDDQQRFQLESKDDLRERGEASPDGADALALTFAAPVNKRSKDKSKSTVRDRLRRRLKPSAMTTRGYDHGVSHARRPDRAGRWTATRRAARARGIGDRARELRPLRLHEGAWPRRLRAHGTL